MAPKRALRACKNYGVIKLATVIVLNIEKTKTHIFLLTKLKFNLTFNYLSKISKTKDQVNYISH